MKSFLFLFMNLSHHPLEGFLSCCRKRWASAMVWDLLGFFWKVRVNSLTHFFMCSSRLLFWIFLPAPFFLLGPDCRGRRFLVFLILRCLKESSPSREWWSLELEKAMMCSKSF